MERAETREFTIVRRPSEAELTPRRIVAELDQHIVGQKAAKKMVAIALRNRWRRRMLHPHLREEIIPKNILMIGPTGVGKTEIARRLAALMEAPFIKVEATKYTEVGYVGRDVESMVRDLAEAAVRMVKRRRRDEVETRAAAQAEEKLLSLLQPPPARPFHQDAVEEAEGQDGEASQLDRLRERLRKQLRKGDLEDHMVEIETQDGGPKMFEIFTSAGVEEMGVNIQEMLGNMMPKRNKKRRMKVSEARKIIVNQEVDKLIDMDTVAEEAIELVEQSGIIFIDEFDKIAGREKSGGGPDVSREGVQRDILPIVEGSTVVTKYGPVKTNHILFFAAGAFHMAKPSDLIPELQGRFPLRVELENLTKEDFKRILTEPKNCLIDQYKALLSSDGVDLIVKEDAVDAIADIACEVNDRTENIGARRLHTVLEKIVEEPFFRAPEDGLDRVVIDEEYVRSKLKPLLEDVDLSRYIL